MVDFDDPFLEVKMAIFGIWSLGVWDNYSAKNFLRKFLAENWDFTDRGPERARFRGLRGSKAELSVILDFGPWVR